MSIYAIDEREAAICNRQLPKVFVTGDLNVDNVVTGISLGSICAAATTAPAVGGSCFNAASALKSTGDFEPIVFGKVGNDIEGNRVIAKLDKLRISHIITRDPMKATGTCNILFFDKAEHPRTIYFSCPSANDYDCDSLQLALEQADLCETDYIFSSFHCIAQTANDLIHCRQFFATLRSSGCKMVVDIVPHTIYEAFQWRQICEIIGGPVFLLIAEFRTFVNLISSERKSKSEPTIEDCDEIPRHFNAKYYLCRYGFGNCSKEWIFWRSASGIKFWPPQETGYQYLNDTDKRGFGDRLTAKILKRIHDQEIKGEING